jgi:hypothetical protein
LGASLRFLLLGSISQGQRDLNHNQLIDDRGRTVNVAEYDDEVRVMIESGVEVVVMIEEC